MIRLATTEDLKEICEIYAYARKFMAEHGNPAQWGDSLPREEVLKQDIEKQHLYVIEKEGKMQGVFALIIGEDPTYQKIEQGAWKDDSMYGTLHRIASAPDVHGIMKQVLDFAAQKIDHLRIDTHEDNQVMQHLIEKNGFEKCGIIYVADGTPRIAYERVVKHEALVQLRVATPFDSKEILDIYAPYIQQTAVTFEYEVPTLEAFTRRMEQTLVKYPYLAAEQNGKIVGYAYAGPLHERAAYDWAVETSIYVKMDAKNQGIGKKLYEALEEALRRQNIVCVNACIAYPGDKEDAHLTKDSVAFHEHLGYQMVGEFHQCAYKFDRWYDMVWMEKSLCARPEKPEPMIWFSKLRKQKKHSEEKDDVENELKQDEAGVQKD